MKKPDLNKNKDLTKNLVQSCLYLLSKHGIRLIVCLLITILASIPVYGIIFLPSVDGPDHWMSVKVLINTLNGNRPGLEVVFIPAYKLFYFLNVPLFYFTELIGFTPKAFPTLSVVLLQFLFSFLVGLKFIQILNQIIEKSEKLLYAVGILLSLVLTLFASLALYSASFYWGFLPFVYSVPFAVLTIIILEDSIAFFNKWNLVFLFCLLFCSCHEFG